MNLVTKGEKGKKYPLSISEENREKLFGGIVIVGVNIYQSTIEILQREGYYEQLLDPQIQKETQINKFAEEIIKICGSENIIIKSITAKKWNEKQDNLEEYINQIYSEIRNKLGTPQERGEAEINHSRELNLNEMDDIFEFLQNQRNSNAEIEIQEEAIKGTIPKIISSIIAKYYCLQEFKEMRKKTGFKIPRENAYEGSGSIIDAFLEIERKGLDKEDFVKCNSLFLEKINQRVYGSIETGFISSSESGRSSLFGGSDIFTVYIDTNTLLQIKNIPEFNKISLVEKLDYDKAFEKAKIIKNIHRIDNHETIEAAELNEYAEENESARGYTTRKHKDIHYRLRKNVWFKRKPEELINLSAQEKELKCLIRYISNIFSMVYFKAQIKKMSILEGVEIPVEDYGMLGNERKDLAFRAYKALLEKGVTEERIDNQLVKKYSKALMRVKHRLIKDGIKLTLPYKESSLIPSS